MAIDPKYNIKSPQEIAALEAKMSKTFQRAARSNLRSQIAIAKRDRGLYNRFAMTDAKRQELLASGSDPRSVDALAKQSLINYENLVDLRAERRSPGIRGGRANAVYRSFEENQPYSEFILSEKDTAEKLKSEVTQQGSLGMIRSARQKIIPQQVARLNRKRGNVSLISGASGGAGFLSGYFK